MSYFSALQASRLRAAVEMQSVKDGLNRLRCEAILEFEQMMAIDNMVNEINGMLEALIPNERPFMHQEIQNDRRE